MQDQIIDGQIEERFRKFKDFASEFSREVSILLGVRSETTRAVTQEQTSKVNLFLARTVFSKWSIEILTVLYSGRTCSFGSIKKDVRGITSRVLSEKLKNLEGAKLVKRTVMNTRPPTVRYSLTERGVTIAKLGEPVFLYAALAEGLYQKPELLLAKNTW